MAAELDIHELPSHATILEHPSLASGQKRALMDEGRYEDPSIASLPSFDKNAWYYPSNGYDDDSNDIRFSSAKGNWGRKTMHDARWVRRGKMTAWGPSVEDWEAEERARKRMRLLMPQEPEVPTSIVLPHLRSPSPPLIAPYPPKTKQHLSYTSFVMDKAITSSFRSRLLDELESATNGLIQGEAAMRRALGRLWQVMSEDPDQASESPVVVPKREDDDDEEDEKERRLSHAPNLTPVVHKLFLSASPDRMTPAFDGAHLAHPEVQLDNLEKSLATLRELQDDGREYVERLEEIRDGLGDARTQRNAVWDLVRNKAIRELQNVASSSASAL